MDDRNITVTGLYHCTTRIPHLEKSTVEMQVSVKKVDGETAEKTAERLKEAAKEFEGKYVGGCEDRSFYRFKALP